MRLNPKNSETAIKLLQKDLDSKTKLLEEIQDKISKIEPSNSEPEPDVDDVEVIDRIIPIEKGGTGASTIEEARANLGISDMFITSTFTKTGESVGANNTKSVDFEIAIDGYTAIGIIDFYIVGTSGKVVACGVFVRNEATQGRINISNTSSSSRTADLAITVLYVKNT